MGGLQGEPIIMDPSCFKQGMSIEEAQKNNLGIKSFVDDASFAEFLDNYGNLYKRPDWDGYLTLKEANEWYRIGNGQPLFVSMDDNNHLFLKKYSSSAEYYKEIERWK